MGACAGGVADERRGGRERRLSPPRLKQCPERNISRLVCPRRLEPRNDYVACVVPATDGGRLRGLGQPVRRRRSVPRGSQQAPTTSSCRSTSTGSSRPGRWATSKRSRGACGRRQQYARRRGADRSSCGTSASSTVAVDGDHLLFDGATPGQTMFEGAMVSLDFKPGAPDARLREKLAGDAEQRSGASTTGAAKADARADAGAADLRRASGEAPHRRRAQASTRTGSTA